MNDKIDFYMEPIRFFKSPLFLSGAKASSSQYQVSINKEQALRLFFSQDVPSDYQVWGDFFSRFESELRQDINFKFADEHIVNNIRAEQADTLKDTIRKRKEYLLRKKAGLIDKLEYDEFVKQVDDECNYILLMVSIQRYLKGEIIDNKLEEIFEIFKTGVLPCGVKKEADELVVFDPAILRMS